LPVNRPTTFLAGKRELLISADPPRHLSNTDSMFSSAQSEDPDDNEDDVFLSARTSLDLDNEGTHIRGPHGLVVLLYALAELAQ